MSDKSLTLTGVAFAIAVMSDAAKAEGHAEKTLEKKRGASWLAVQEAAGAFGADMSEADKTTLSGQLAKVYAQHYPASSAKVVASQHARAIYLLATGSKPDGHGNIAAFLNAHKKAPVKSGGTAPAADASGSPAAPAPTTIAQQTLQSGALLSGASIELGSAIARLVDAAKRMPGLEDALLLAANRPTDFIAAMENMLTERKPATPAKVAQLADKFKAAA